MILYNTLMGVAAGLSLILVTLLARKLRRRELIAPEGWALTFGVLGVILTALGGLMAVTWPLTVNPPINIMFAEPTLVLGLLMLAAAVFLWTRRELIMALAAPKAESAFAQLSRTLAPVSWLVFGLGMILASCALAIWRFNIVGGAPTAEPITGLLHDYPGIENGFFVMLYGLSALGALLAPWAWRRPNGAAARVMGWAWMTAGVCFLLFSAMNYYTHMGLLMNTLQGKDFKF